jgi:hypothetical protein
MDKIKAKEQEILGVETDRYTRIANGAITLKTLTSRPENMQFQFDDSSNGTESLSQFLSTGKVTENYKF